MPNTRQYTDESMQEIGPGRLFVEVENASGTKMLFELGPATDLAVRLAREVVAQEAIRKGIRYTVSERIRSLSGELSGRLLENVNPAVSKYLLGIGETQVKAASTVMPVKESFKLYGTDERIVGHAANIVAQMPEPSSFNATLFGTGGPPDGTYSFAVVAWYDEDEETGSFPDSADEKAENVEVTASREKIAMDWTAPSNVTPHHYSIYKQDAASFDETQPAQKIAETTATSFVQGATFANLGSKTFGDSPPGPFDLFSFDQGTTYVVNTDYTFDVGTGAIKRVAGGSIPEGETLLLLYSYTVPAAITTPIGVTKARPTYVKLVVLQLEEGADGFEVGSEWSFYRVNTQAGDTNVSFNEDDYSQGFDFTWNLLYSLSDGKIAQKVDRNGVFTDFDLNY